MSLSQNSSKIYEVLNFPQIFKTENISKSSIFSNVTWSWRRRNGLHYIFSTQAEGLI